MKMIREILQFLFDAFVQLIQKILDIIPNMLSIKDEKDCKDSNTVCSVSPGEEKEEVASGTETPPSVQTRKVPDLPQDLTSLKARCVNMKPDVLQLLKGKIQEELAEAKTRGDGTRAQELRELSWKVTDLLCCGTAAVKKLETKTPWQQKQEKNQKKYQKKKKEWKQPSYSREQQSNSNNKRGRNNCGRFKQRDTVRSTYFHWTNRKFHVDEMIQISHNLVADVIKCSLESLITEKRVNEPRKSATSSRGRRRGGGRTSESSVPRRVTGVNENLQEEQEITKIADDLVQSVLETATSNIICAKSEALPVSSSSDNDTADSTKALINTAITFVDHIITMSIEKVLKEPYENKAKASPTQKELLLDIVSTPTKDGICFNVSDNRVIKIEKF